MSQEVEILGECARAVRQAYEQVPANEAQDSPVWLYGTVCSALRPIIERLLDHRASMTPAEEKVIKVATDLAEVGHNIGFDNLPSVAIHDIYDAVEALKREGKVSGVPGETVVIPGESMSTEERARRFKFAMAEYARYHREWLRQSSDLAEAQKNVARLEEEVKAARAKVLGLIGNTTYLDFMEALHWRYVESQ